MAAPLVSVLAATERGRSRCGACCATRRGEARVGSPGRVPRRSNRSAPRALPSGPILHSRSTRRAVVLTAGQDPVFIFDIEFKAAEQIVEVILAILLFTDATEVPGGVLGREPRLTLRLLLIALPLSLLMGWLVGVVLLHGVNLWLLAVLATIVMPLDLAPAAAFVRDHRIPERLRQVLTAESGLTDGIVAPVFLFCLAAATAAANEAQADAAMDDGPALVVAVLIGALVGAVAARVLHRALRAGWTSPLRCVSACSPSPYSPTPGRSSSAATGSLLHSLPASSSSPRRVGCRPTRCTSSRTSVRCSHWRCGSSSAPS